MLDLVIGVSLLFISLIDFYFAKKLPSKSIKGKAIRRRFHFAEDFQREIHRLVGILFFIGSVLFITLASINYLADYEILTKTVWSVYMITCIIIIEIYVFSKTMKW